MTAAQVAAKEKLHSTQFKAALHVPTDGKRHNKWNLFVIITTSSDKYCPELTYWQCWESCWIFSL